MVKQLRAALITRGLRTAAELPEDCDAAAAVPVQPASQRPMQPEAEPIEQATAEPTVLFGSSRCRQVHPGECNEGVRGLASDLGKAWEVGHPMNGAKVELHDISRANEQLLLERNVGEQAKLKRARKEEACASRTSSEPCLCTPDGAAALLR